MASPVVSLAVVERVSTVLEVLESTTHNGFPVLASAGKASGLASLDGGAAGQSGSGNGVAGSGAEGVGRSSGRMVGLVLRSQVGVGWFACSLEGARREPCAPASHQPNSHPCCLPAPCSC